MNKFLLSISLLTLTMILFSCDVKPTRVYSIGDTRTTSNYDITLSDVEAIVIDDYYQITITFSITNVAEELPFDSSLFSVTKYGNVYSIDVEKTLELNGQPLEGMFFTPVKLVFSNIPIGNELDIMINANDAIFYV
ncbi:Uncharacterised protein [Acholeplasma oculi]|uniref:DUF4352 domain-containing protein n=1 Tax=Acholeplasma oculi TaxID=35623 RepID=A0A061ADJ1_9MOLU|nr:hypothetical protein [Acholeplasma oculi]CDR31499.1 hypothetical protein Aocu_14260 [Acholeplasma oculi]SKC49390.1 hypothetical protein SAMN02745122_1403 [Acholeplasma oculi]SUT92264.1 Uncharacterised protein [Acholeplasma oculi]